MSGTTEPPQTRVDEYFDSESSYWNEIYSSPDVQGLVYRRRMAAALQWVRELGLPSGARALDIGCGAGLLTIELARLGLSVTATDSSPEMVRSAQANATRLGLDDRIEVREADAHRLPFEAGEFELVTLLGLLPWLHDAPSAVRELGRVLAIGGTILVTADNLRRLGRVVEPRENPLMSPLRPVKRALSRPPEDGSYGAPAVRHRAEEVDGLLADAGITVERRTTIGYGPFTVMGRRILPDGLGRIVDERLQGAALDHPRLRRVGWHYLAAGVKRAP